MKKSPNKVAITLWVLAAVSLALNSVEIWSTYRNMSPLRQEAGEAYLAWAAYAHSISAILVQFAFLLGLGMLIEIADRVLWEIRHKNQRG